MSGKTDPGAMQPSGVQAAEFSDRNPAVATWGGTDAEGGLVSTPALAQSRVTRAGAAISPEAGLKNYDATDSVDTVEDEAEREG
jgi:hypothetical protein